MSRWRRVAALLLWFLAPAARAAGPPSPSEFLGFTVGADRSTLSKTASEITGLLWNHPARCAIWWPTFGALPGSPVR